MYLALPLYQRDLTDGRVPTTAEPATAGASDGAAQPANGKPGQDGNSVAGPAVREAADGGASGSGSDSEDDRDGAAGRRGSDGARDGGVTLHGVVRRTAKLADDRRGGCAWSCVMLAHKMKCHFKRTIFVRVSTLAIRCSTIASRLKRVSAPALRSTDD